MKALITSLLALMLCASCAPSHHENAPTPAPRIVRHADLARTIVRMMGDEPKMPARATAMDYQNYLAGQGIVPLGGWRYMEPVTEGDLAVVTVRLLKLQDRVESPGDEQAYIALLKSMEIESLFSANR